MKMRGMLPTLLVLVLGTTIITTQSSSAAATGQGPSAFGAGAFTFFNGIRNEGWSFSFDVAANKNGQAHGRATFDISDNLVQTQVVVKIDCLRVSTFAGIGDAVMSGTVLHSDDPSYPKHSRVLFAAEDNSGFATFRSDIMTPIFVIDEFEGDCRDLGPPLTMIQVGDAITITP